MYLPKSCVCFQKIYRRKEVVKNLQATVQLHKKKNRIPEHTRIVIVVYSSGLGWSRMHMVLYNIDLGIYPSISRYGQQMKTLSIARLGELLTQ